MNSHSSNQPTPSKPSDTDQADAEWTASDPLWKLLDQASNPEPDVFFARNVMREARQLTQEPVTLGARLTAIFSPARLALGAAACACVMFGYQMISSPNATPASGTVAKNTPVQQPLTKDTAEVSATSDLSELVIVETLDAAAEDPTIFTRDEVVAMLGL
ncbi:hypothetical protein NT6N_10970 [Oceaniferula spumae]|uniref:Uncharacterized protein n=1 Tax=Oceaniferula spumae TaxID=2979115 RepID=A0AAT9FJD8_9BACT